MSTEAEFQEQVVQLLNLTGWRHLHVRRSIGKGRKWVTATNLVGWPDLLCWHERQRRVLALELKTETGKTTAEQDAVLASLGAAGVEAMVLRPHQLQWLASWLREAA